MFNRGNMVDVKPAKVSEQEVIESFDVEASVIDPVVEVPEESTVTAIENPTSATINRLLNCYIKEQGEFVKSICLAVAGLPVGIWTTLLVMSPIPVTIGAALSVLGARNALMSKDQMNWYQREMTSVNQVAPEKDKVLIL